MDNSSHTCAGCQRSLPKREYLKCVACQAFYDIDCANITYKFFSIMTKKDKWQCPECKSNMPKTGNVNTPIRPVTTSSQEKDGLSSPSASSSESDFANVTMRSRPTTKGPEVSGEAKLSSDLIVEIRLLREDMRAVRAEMSEFRHAISSLTSAVGVCNSRIDELALRVEVLENQSQATSGGGDTSSLEKSIENLKLELNDRDQQLLSNDIEIAGIPEEKNENSTHLMLTVAAKLGIDLEERDVVSAERSGAVRRAEPSGAEAPPRPLVVRLARRAQRDELLNAARVRRNITTAGLGLSTSERRFYVNERLTRSNRHIFHKARSESQRANWKYVWTRDGKIFTRKEHGASRYRLRSEEDISKTFGLIGR